MFRKAKLRVKVDAGMFGSERTVSFVAGQRVYNLLVDAVDVTDNQLEVGVIAESAKEKRALIQLPRDTFSSGSRIFVPSALLEPAL